MCAAPQGLVPETVTESAAPTATDGAAAWTPVTVPAEATPLDMNEQNRRADVHFMTDTGARPRPEYGPAAVQASWAEPRVLPSISCCVRKMLHQSLCSAMGMPHSTHTRMRVFGSAFFEKSFWKRVICPETEDPASRFAEKNDRLPIAGSN